jgi:phosphoinositide-3-kinase regulatory subunit 4
MASCSADGTIHVWRVELAASRGGSGSSSGRGAKGSDGASAADLWGYVDVADSVNSSPLTGQSSAPGVSVCGLSVVRTVDPQRGPIVALHHYNSDVASVVTYATQRGHVGGWDLRAVREAFAYSLRPELGYATSMTVSPDRHWVVVGTSRGYVSLWDIRYNAQCRLWRHSSGSAIHRLACCRNPNQGTSQSLGRSQGQGQGQSEQAPEGAAYLFTAAGNNEASVWSVPDAADGECLKCFRTVRVGHSRVALDPLPQLIDTPLPRHPMNTVRSAVSGILSGGVGGGDGDGESHSVRAIVGRISPSGASYLMTAGTDRHIRYWDFGPASRCFTVAGHQPWQPKPNCETPAAAIFGRENEEDGDGVSDSTATTTAPPSSSSSSTSAPRSRGEGRLTVCYDYEEPSASSTVLPPSQLPLREGRGPLPPTTAFKVRSTPP